MLADQPARVFPGGSRLLAKARRVGGVLRGQKRPAILIEAGYLSNPQEARLIENPEYRQKLAEAFANGLK